MSMILSFLLGPLGKYALVAVAVLAAVAFIDRKATYRERAKCQAAAIQAKLDAANADLRAEREARERDKVDAAELEKEKSKTDAENDALKVEIAKLPLAEQCIITKDREKRLRR